MGLGPVDYIVYIQGVRFRACLLSKPAHALCVRWQAIKGLAGVCGNCSKVQMLPD